MHLRERASAEIAFVTNLVQLVTWCNLTALRFTCTSNSFADHEFFRSAIIDWTQWCRLSKSRQSDTHRQLLRPKLLRFQKFRRHLMDVRVPYLLYSWYCFREKPHSNCVWIYDDERIFGFVPNLEIVIEESRLSGEEKGRPAFTLIPFSHPGRITAEWLLSYRS